MIFLEEGAPLLQEVEISDGRNHNRQLFVQRCRYDAIVRHVKPNTTEKTSTLTGLGKSNDCPTTSVLPIRQQALGLAPLLTGCRIAISDLNSSDKVSFYVQCDLKTYKH